jgi:hypothetical protein
MASPCEKHDDGWDSLSEWLTGCVTMTCSMKTASVHGDSKQARPVQVNSSSSLTRARSSHPRALVMNTRVGLGMMATT